MPSGVFFRIRAVRITHFTLLYMDKLIQYLKETKTELKEVIFPTNSQTITYTVLVIIISIIVAIGLGGIDIGLRALLELVVNR